MNSEKALEITELMDTPPDEDNYKFVLTSSGAVFWVAPFEAAGGKRWGQVWETYEDSPTHSEVISHLGMDEGSFHGAGYCTDGDIMVYTDDPIENYADHIRSWWPHIEFLEWNGEEYELPDLKIAKVANLDQLTQDPNAVEGNCKLILTKDGPWFFDGMDHGPAASLLMEQGLITDDNFIGAGFYYKADPKVGMGGEWAHLYELSFDVEVSEVFQMMPYLVEIDLEADTDEGVKNYLNQNNRITASIRERVLSRGITAMGYLGCFWCRKPVEKAGTIVTSRFYPDREEIDTLVPSCIDCRR